MAKIADEAAEEPRPVLPFERDLLIVNDEAVHECSAASAAQ
jgi:hypothetical protein